MSIAPELHTQIIAAIHLMQTVIRWKPGKDIDGIMETAFVVENPKEYLGQPEFELIGKLYEVLR